MLSVVGRPIEHSHDSFLVELVVGAQFPRVCLGQFDLELASLVRLFHLSEKCGFIDNWFTQWVGQVDLAVSLVVVFLVDFGSGVLHEHLDDSLVVHEASNVNRHGAGGRLDLSGAIGKQEPTQLGIVVVGGPVQGRESDDLSDEVDIGALLDQQFGGFESLCLDGLRAADAFRANVTFQRRQEQGAHCVAVL